VATLGSEFGIQGEHFQACYQLGAEAILGDGGWSWKSKLFQ